MKIANVHGVEWKMDDNIYEWHRRYKCIEVGPESIWNSNPEIVSEMTAFKLYCIENSPSVFIDIGTYCGIVSSVYCSLVKDHRCYSIEPIRSHCERLQNTAKLNNWNLSTHPIGLNNYVGKCYYHNTNMARFTNDPNFKVSDAEINSNPENAKIHEVNIDTLDNFVKSNNIKPNLIKIDVEGYEVPILEKAQETLSNDAVDLFIETHRNECIELGWNIEKLCDYIPQKDYIFYTTGLLYDQNSLPSYIFRQRIFTDLKDYILNHKSTMRFVAINKKNLG